jgi:predicted permease
MSEPLLKLLPVFLLFLGGVAAHHLGYLQPRHADRLLNIVVTVGLPALILAVVSRVSLTREDAWLPLLAILTTLITWPLAWLSGTRLALPRTTLGVFIIGPMILNLAAVYPFVLAYLGERGLAEIVLFDFGGLLVTLTLTYGIACWYGGTSSQWRRIFAQLARFPPVWALAVALAINISGHAIPDVVLNPLQVVGEVALWLIMLALGVYFRWHTTHAGALVSAFVLRGGMGLLLGAVWVAVFELSGTTRAVVLAACMAPVGFNTLVFAAKAGLDREFAAAAVSVSLLLALVYLPLLLWTAT